MTPELAEALTALVWVVVGLLVLAALFLSTS